MAASRQRGPFLPPLLGDVATAAYVPRRTDETVLHQVVAEQLKTFLARVRDRGRPAPCFVKREFRRFLELGSMGRVSVELRARHTPLQLVEYVEDDVDLMRFVLLPRTLNDHKATVGKGIGTDDPAIIGVQELARLRYHQGRLDGDRDLHDVGAVPIPQQILSVLRGYLRPSRKLFTADRAEDATVR